MSPPGYDVWETDGISIPNELLFRVLDSLRSAHIYALKDSHPDELGGDFKPEKWDGHEISYAISASRAYHDLIEVMEQQT